MQWKYNYFRPLVQKLFLYIYQMEQAYFIARLKDITMPELLDAIAEANAGKRIDIYEHLAPDLIDKTTDTLYEFIDAVKGVKK